MSVASEILKLENVIFTSSMDLELRLRSSLLGPRHICRSETAAKTGSFKVATSAQWTPQSGRALQSFNTAIQGSSRLSMEAPRLRRETYDISLESWITERADTAAKILWKR